MADIGSLLQGFTATFQAGQDRKMKRDELELQGKLIKAKIAQDDIETQMKQQKSTMLMQLFTGMGGVPSIGGNTSPVPGGSSVSPGMSSLDLPGIIANQNLRNPMPNPAPSPSMSPTAPGATASSGGGMDVTNMFTPQNVARGIFKENFGIDPKENERWTQADYVDPTTGQPGKIDKEMTTGRTRPGTFVPSPESNKTTFQQENQLRDQFTAATAPFRLVRDSWGRIQESAAKPGGAGDLALIYDYMKMLDPGSTVREGEFANAQNAGGIDDKIRAEYNRLANGGRLSDQQRANFVDVAGKMFGAANNQYKQVVNEYSRIAGQYQGVDPKRVIVDFSLSVGNKKPNLSLGKKNGLSPEDEAAAYLNKRK